MSTPFADAQAGAALLGLRLVKVPDGKGCDVILVIDQAGAARQLRTIEEVEAIWNAAKEAAP